MVHANDSQAPCGSRKDRHTNIGDGYINLDGFSHLIDQPDLTQVPWILETPNLGRRAQDLAKLMSLDTSSLVVPCAT
ncbi:MAG: TIM barrel protein [Chloroflexota bacterium]